MKLFTRTLLAAGAATSLAAAQATEVHSEGPFMAAPHGLSVDGNTWGPGGQLDATQVLLKSPGFETAAPVPWTPAPPLPDFRIAAILQNVTPRPDIDAVSIGLDWVLSDGDGQVEVPPGHWGGITFSVTRATAGKNGGAINLEINRPDGAAADLFSYILPGSALPPELVDITQRAQDSPEIDVYQPGKPGDMDAHDLFLSLIFRDNPGVLAQLPPPLQTPRVFFSVTRATRGKVPSSWWAGSAPSGATILTSDWDGSTSTWNLPQPFLLYSELGLGVDDEVDAVAVDWLRQHMLFSTTSGALDPVLWAGFGVDAVKVKPYRLKSGESISTRIGLLSGDDVDAICALDPGGDPIVRELVGAPQPVPFRLELAASVFRQSFPTGEVLRSFMAGWPPQTGRGPGLSGGFLGLLAPTGWIPLQVWPMPQRDPLNPVGGDPRLVEVPIPPPVSMSGLQVFFWWGAIDHRMQDFAISHQLRVIL